MVPEPDKDTRFTPEGWTGLKQSHLLALHLWQAEFRERTETERSGMNSDSDDDGVMTVVVTIITTAHAHGLTQTDLTSNSVSVRLSSLRPVLVFFLLWASHCCGELKRTSKGD